LTYLRPGASGPDGSYFAPRTARPGEPSELPESKSFRRGELLLSSWPEPPPLRGQRPPYSLRGQRPPSLRGQRPPNSLRGQRPPPLVGNGPLLSRAWAPSFAGCVPSLRRPTSSPLLVGRAPSGSSRAEPIPVVGRSPPCARLSSVSLASAGSPQDRAKSRLVCALAAAVAHGAVWR